MNAVATVATKLTWASLGGGSYRSTDGRWSLQADRRYLGRKGGRPQTERWVTVTDKRPGSRPRDVGTVREAKALCARLAAEAA